MELLQLRVHEGKDKLIYDFALSASGGTYHFEDDKAYRAFAALLGKEDVHADLFLDMNGQKSRFPIDFPLAKRDAVKKELLWHLLDTKQAARMLMGEAAWFDEKPLTDFLQAVAKSERLPKIRRARMLEAAGGENKHQLSFLVDCRHHRQLSLCALANAHLDELSVGHYRIAPQGDGFSLLDMHTGEQFLFAQAEDDLRYYASIAFSLAYKELQSRQPMPVFPLLMCKEAAVSDLAKAAVRSYFYKLVKSGKR